MIEKHWTEEIDRLRKVYADMGDGQLEALAREAYTLTDAARHALKDELAVRRMDLPLRDAPALKNAPAEPDLDLIVFRRVGDLSEARWLRQVLEDAGVACFVEPDFLDLKILRADFKRASQATQGLLPPEPEDDPSDVVFEGRCPACRSTEIVFEGLDAELDADAKFKWTCDGCGHQWTDDGVEQG
jgi:hypothetical protein